MVSYYNIKTWENNPEIFRFKFKREPRIRTIKELNELWLKTKERVSINRNNFYSILEMIINSVESTGVTHSSYYGAAKRYIVFFYQTTNGKEYLRQYELNYSGGKKYSYSINNTDLKSREDRLDFILSNQKAFELGQSFHEAIKLLDGSRRSEGKIRKALWYKVEKILEKKYNENSPEVLLIELEGIQYFVKKTEHSFELCNVYDGNILKIE